MTGTVQLTVIVPIFPPTSRLSTMDWYCLVSAAAAVCCHLNQPIVYQITGIQDMAIANNSVGLGRGGGR